MKKFLLAADMRQRSKMVEGNRLMPTLQWLPKMRERALVDTGLWLEPRGGLALGVINRAERLCLLCPKCRILMVEVTAWTATHPSGTRPAGAMVFQH